ncbi:ribonuclease H family protein [Actinotignum urinale]|uniref:Ribonuclease H n=1 Tax=Actinotignum urinale TaxID=190146 RepID=A0ABU5G6K5_9ACTO|nr:ribonuclease H [Actinotignum urinale]MDY5132699.1 ribonuclease H [Actinotignum urinale]
MAQKDDTPFGFQPTLDIFSQDTPQVPQSSQHDIFSTTASASTPQNFSQYEQNTQPAHAHASPINATTGQLAHSIGGAFTGYDIVVATDGACKGNPGPGGWAWVNQLTGEYASGGSKYTTNNIMELTALINALETLDKRGRMLIRADSQYVINIVTKWARGWKAKGWKTASKKPVANKELVERLMAAYDARTGVTEFEWVRGHSGDAGNEFVDKQAVRESNKF